MIDTWLLLLKSGVRGKVIFLHIVMLLGNDSEISNYATDHKQQQRNDVLCAVLDDML
jgi:hypothetical protein